MVDLLVLVNGLPGSGKTTLADRLGEVMDAVVISKDVIKEALHSALGNGRSAQHVWGAAAMEAAWTLAAGTSGTVLVESWWFAPRDRDYARAGIAATGAARVVEVWCDAGTDVARARYARRCRPDLYRDVAHLERDWAVWADQARPLDLAPVVMADTATDVDVDVAALAGRIRAVAAQPATYPSARG